MPDISLEFTKAKLRVCQDTTIFWQRWPLCGPGMSQEEGVGHRLSEIYPQSEVCGRKDAGS